MAVWNPHPLSGPQEQGLVLEPGQRCKATLDLPGVPTGTSGTVLLANGFVWLRYRVRFDSGVELTFLDGRHIEAARGRR